VCIKAIEMEMYLARTAFEFISSGPKITHFVYYFDEVMLLPLFLACYCSFIFAHLPLPRRLSKRLNASSYIHVRGRKYWR